MNKNVLIGTLSILVLIGGAFWLTQGEPADALTQDYKTAKYEVNGEMIELEANGFSYFGNEVWGDFNNDGRQDVSFLITQEAGDKTLFYVTAAFNLTEGYEGMNAIFVGENILPQTTEYGQNVIVVNYGNNTEATTPEQATSMASTFFLVSNTGLEQIGQ